MISVRTSSIFTLKSVRSAVAAVSVLAAAGLAQASDSPFAPLSGSWAGPGTITLASGAKALVCKADDRFVMIVLPADRKLASKLARKSLAIKSLRFATREEVEELTGLAPGAIPPFGSLFDLPTCCDQKLAAEERINFNAGDHGISISMTFADYVAAENPQLGLFAE